MDATAPTTETPQEETYMQFAMTRYPLTLTQYPYKKDLSGELKASMWVAQRLKTPMDHQGSARVSIVDYQAQPRAFHLWSDPKLTDPEDGLATVQAHLRGMKRFIRESPNTSQGLVILWDRDGNYRKESDEYYFQAAVGLALAEILSVHPGTLHGVDQQMCEEKRAHLFYGIDGLVHENTDIARVLQVCSRKRAASIPGSYCATLDLPLVGAKIFNLNGCSMLAGHSLPIYLIPTYEFSDKLLKFKLFDRLFAKPSAELCIHEFVSREVELLSHAMKGVIQRLSGIGVGQHTYKASRYLRFSTKFLRRDLENWQSSMKAPESVTDVLKQLSEVRHEIELFEPDVQDAYQTYVNHKTLLDAQKSIQMADRSIEMSEKSIKESERVRIITIIALIFLPISLASSIFGMNVTAINSDRTPLWAFIVTAIALFIGALLIWAGSSIFTRYQKLSHARIRALGKREGDDDWNIRKARLITYVPKHLRWRAAVTSWWSRGDAMEELFDLDQSQRERGLHQEQR